MAGRRPHSAGARHPESAVLLAIAAGIVLGVGLIYGRTAGYPYIPFDDDTGLYKNPHVVGGLGAGSLAWAFTTVHLGNWIPVTWISHLIDFSVFGPRPGWHHLVNVLIHAANSVLLFLLFLRMTGAVGASGALAALWAFHPLRVESVVWIIERKDVLSALFGLAAIWVYVAYTGRARPRSAGTLYTGLVALFVLGLLAKPMLVTLPFLLLLLDVWPLGRMGRGAALVVEKLPLFAISAIWCVIALVAQRRAGGVRTLAEMPLTRRVAGAAVSYLEYLRLSFWPSGLSIYYPHEVALPAWKALGAAVLLAAITAGCLALARSRPYLAVGWLWYLGSLVPVIGFVQIGGTAMADRYTYLPSIGLGIAIVWGAADLAGARSARGARTIAAAIAAAAAVVLAALSWRQVSHWRDGISLFERAAAIAPRAPLVHNNLATAYAQKGRVDDAIAQYRQTLALDPAFPDANANLGLALFGRGQDAEAIALYRAELRRDPNHPEALCHLGVALAVQGRLGEALAQFEAAARARPDYADAYYDMGLALDKLGRPAEAIAAYERSLAIDPKNADARAALGRLRAP